jgi:hypothetical protein
MRGGSARQTLAMSFCNTRRAYTVFWFVLSVQICGRFRVQCATNIMATTETIAVPKRITNAQTVCNEKNEKGKLCNGHLKQLRTAGEPAQVHLRGDDVLFKCHTCGTLYMGPPLGHVRDPNKQVRFVEAELTALLQAAGGTLPVIKKDEQRGVFVMVETVVGDHGAHAAKPAAAAKSAAPAAPKAQATAPATGAPAAPKPVTPAAKPAEHKTLGQNPNRQLFRRSTYVGVKDTGPVPGETFEQKVARLKAVSAAAKQRAEEGGEMASLADGASSEAGLAPQASASSELSGSPEASAASQASAAYEMSGSSQASAASQTSAASTSPNTPATASVVQSPAEMTAPAVAPASSTHKPTGNADRSLMKRSTYCGVVDTGPVPGETFEQKVARLAALSAAAKQRSEGG